jgi:hypothetical protein
MKINKIIISYVKTQHYGKKSISTEVEELTVNILREDRLDSPTTTEIMF